MVHTSTKQIPERKQTRRAPRNKTNVVYTRTNSYISYIRTKSRYSQDFPKTLKNSDHLSLHNHFTFTLYDVVCCVFVSKQNKTHPRGEGVPSALVVVCPGPLHVGLEALDRRRPDVHVQAHGLHRFALCGVEVARVRPNLRGWMEVSLVGMGLK